MVVFGGYDGMDGQFTGQGGPVVCMGGLDGHDGQVVRFFGWSVLLPLKF